MIRIFTATILLTLAKIGTSEEPKKAYMDMTMCKGVTQNIGKSDFRARVVTPTSRQMRKQKLDNLIDWCENSLKDYNAWEVVHDVKDNPEKPLIIYEERQVKDCHWKRNREGEIIPDKNSFRFMDTMPLGEPLEIRDWTRE